MSNGKSIEAAVSASGRSTVWGLFRQQVRRRPEAVAVDHAGVTTSYARLADRARRLAGLFRSLGVGRGDRIAILSENRPEYIEAELASAMLGAILACQNWRLAAPELQHCIRLVEPKLVLVSPVNTAKLTGLDIGEPRIVGIGPELERLMADAGPVGPDPAVDPEDGLVVLYTSGTTGLPKGALVSQRAMIARMAAARMDVDWHAEDAFIAWAPMFHMASTDQQLNCLMSGGTVVVVDGMQADPIIDALERYRVGHFVMIPGAIEPFLARIAERGCTPIGVGVAGAMADLVPRQQILDLMEVVGAPYCNSFGATETGMPPCSAALIQPGDAGFSLSKRQSSLCEIKLVDEDDNDVPDGEPGELAIRGPTVFSGYWNAPEANAKDFRGGWFHMGDLFRRNPDATYDFVDRAKYMIKSGGENIYPAEIERVLLADPRIAEAVVVKAKDARWSEVPVAFVAPEDANLTEAEVMALCRQNLAGYKRPREVRFIAVEDFPRSTSGKVQRHEMEPWVEHG